ncbi:MAG: NUDIX hydrolase, partial [Victivallales bacterium]
MKRIACEQIAAGKWLLLNELTYEDRKGKIRTWEAAARQNCAGAVAIICTLKPSNRLILVRQYRPPVNKLTIEFPAGLVNRG